MKTLLAGSDKQLKYWLRLGAVGLAITGGLELVRSFLALFDPLTLDYSEMLVAGMARQLELTSSLAAIYAPPHTPYGLPGVQYPPLFMLLNAALLHLSHWTPLLTARLVAWTAYVGSGGLVGWLVWQETGKRSAALVASFVPFCFWSVIIFVSAARPDPLALFFSLLAALFYRRFRQNKINSVAFLLGVAAVCALAFFSKQTYLAVGAAIFFDLGLTPNRRKQAAVFGLTLGILLSGGALLLNGLTDGAFGGIFDPARAARFIFDKAPGFVGFFILDHLPLLLIAASALVWQLRQGQKFWPLYTLFATLACATIVKDGAVDYYFNELAYILSVQVGLALASSFGGQAAAKETTSSDSRRNFWRAGAVGLQMLIAVGMFVGWSQSRDFDNFRQAYAQGVDLVRQAQAQKQATLVFADNLLLATDQIDQIGDYFIYSILVENKQRDPQPLLHALEQGRYDLIISEEFFRWPAVFQTALNTHYNLQYLNGQDGRHLFKLYVRRP